MSVRSRVPFLPTIFRTFPGIVFDTVLVLDVVGDIPSSSGTSILASGSIAVLPGTSLTVSSEEVPSSLLFRPGTTRGSMPSTEAGIFKSLALPTRRGFIAPQKS